MSGGVRWSAVGGLQIPGELGKAWDSGAQEIGACDQVVCGPVCHSGFGTKKAGWEFRVCCSLAEGPGTRDGPQCLSLLYCEKQSPRIQGLWSEMGDCV